MRGTGWRFPERVMAMPGLSRSIPSSAWRSGWNSSRAGSRVGDDVEARLLLRPDGEERGVVLRLREIGLRNTPQLGGAHARRNVLCQPLAVDQPVG